MSVEIPGKVVVVTGGASGIGRALARRAAADGAKGVAVVDITAEGAQGVADEIGGLGLAVDMADEHAVEAAIDQIESVLGPIDIFCSNAGIGGGGGCEVPTDAWQREWDVNVMAHIAVGRVLIPRWIERGSGHMMITASAAGLLTQIGSAPYAVTKAAAVALAEWLAITHGDQGVTFSALCPQAVRTAMTAGLEDHVASVDGMIEPEEVAQCVVDAWAAGEFLILPHDSVREYMKRKADDRDRWIGGMRKLQRMYPSTDF